jgi:hypothetical protein
MSNKPIKMIAAVVLAIAVFGTAAAWLVHDYHLKVAAERRKECIDNLRSISAAKSHWANELFSSTNHIHFSGSYEEYQRAGMKSSPITNDLPTWDDIRPWLPWHRDGGDVIPRCPAGGTYTIGRVADFPTCSVPGHALER